MARLTLPPTLRFADVPSVLATLAQLLASPEREAIVVDGEALTAFDSSAVACLLECQRQASRGGRVVQWSKLPPRLQALARLYGLGDVLNLPATL